jgi:murein L,D-transpeptidase YafK
LIRIYSCLVLIPAIALGAATASAESVFLPPEHARYPAFILQLPDSVPDVLIADASTATLWRFANGGDDVQQIDRQYMSVGANGVGKQRAWDRKTPLGVYFVTGSLDTSKMHEKYGAAAFPLDYPNAWDRYNSRTGYGIWLHGVDRNDPERPPLDTDGCLALSNEALLQLADRLRPLVTPVVVAREIDWVSSHSLRVRRNEFRAALETWRVSLQQEDLLTYLSLYHDDFRHRNMDKSDWSAYRLRVFEARQLAQVSLQEVLLMADPETPNLYLSRFNQVLETNDGQVTTTKRLYWRREAENRWKIISEDAG